MWGCWGVCWSCARAHSAKAAEAFAAQSDAAPLRDDVDFREALVGHVARGSLAMARQALSQHEPGLTKQAAFCFESSFRLIQLAQAAQTLAAHGSLAVSDDPYAIDRRS